MRSAADQGAYQRVNARLLRARLLLQTGKALGRAKSHERALQIVGTIRPGRRSTSRRERLRWRALGRDQEALEAAEAATRLSRVVEVRVLAAACQSIVSARAGDLRCSGSPSRDCTRTRRMGSGRLRASRFTRSCRWLSGTQGHERDSSSRLYAASNDLGLARRAGFRTRATRRPGELLDTPRAGGTPPNIARHAEPGDRPGTVHLPVHDQGSRSARPREARRKNPSRSGRPL